MIDEAICIPKSLPDDLRVVAAQRALDFNPSNRPRVDRIIRLLESYVGRAAGEFVLRPEHIALVTSKYWGSGGVRLTVGFMETCPADLRDRILAHMNTWGRYANVSFVWTQTDPKVRISRGRGGYWSYLGTDILSIPVTQQTMNLEALTMATPDAEFGRVVWHEAGHTLGCPHEHMRPELVARIDPQKAIDYFGRTQGWTASMVRQQVLTPLNEASIRGTAQADQDSIMCYQIPGFLTFDGQPIRGGSVIDPIDQQFMNKQYPKPEEPQPPIEPPVKPPVHRTKTIVVNGQFDLLIDGKPIA